MMWVMDLVFDDTRAPRRGKGLCEPHTPPPLLRDLAPDAQRREKGVKRRTPPDPCANMSASACGPSHCTSKQASLSELAPSG